MHKTLTMLAPAGTEADTAELHDLYRRTIDGWNQGSGHAFAAGWAEDGHFVAFDGSHLTGQGEIARAHEELFQTHLKGTRLVGGVTEVTFATPEVAVLHARGNTILPGATEPAPERDSIKRLVAVRRSDEWRLLAFQNTRVRPIGRDLAGTLWWLISDWVWRGLAKVSAALREAAR
jgi:uncharacterized protein (TIGR02246 family)